MIAFIKGKVVDVSDNKVIIEANGIGYLIHTTEKNIKGLESKNGCSFWVYTAVRENDISLYGFGKKEEKDIFELLLSVSGIGPKSALTILKTAGIEILEKAIQTSKTEELIKIGGVGKKTAEKIVLELSGKIIKTNISKPSDFDDIVDALKALGYREKDVLEHIKEIPEHLSGTNEKIKWLLKNIK